MATRRTSKAVASKTTKKKATTSAAKKRTAIKKTSKKAASSKKTTKKATGGRTTVKADTSPDGAAKKVTKPSRPSKTSSQPHLTEEGVRKSKAFRDASSKAEEYARDPKKLNDLFDKASKKAKSTPRGPFAETWAYLMAMLRLIRAYAKKEYRDIPWQSLIWIIIAVVYFVSPIDIIPDFIPVVGYIDDAFVVGLVLRPVRGDLDAFMAWETE